VTGPVHAKLTKAVEAVAALHTAQADAAARIATDRASRSEPAKDETPGAAGARVKPAEAER
jgi:hypothetical protein